MAETKKMNVYSKLIRARKRFIDKGVEKSGKNMGLAFKYFELEDIVPTVTAIFDSLGLLAVVNFIDLTIGENILPYARMEIIDCDNPTDTIMFSLPVRFAESNKGTTPIQALGSTITYIRRYLYLVAMDVCEADEIDADKENGKDTAEKPTEKKAEKPVVLKETKPVTAEQRAEAKAEVTEKTSPANALQIKKIKELLNALRLLDSANDEFVKTVMNGTDNLANLTTAKALELIKQLKDMVKKYKEQN